MITRLGLRWFRPAFGGVFIERLPNDHREEALSDHATVPP
jgi:hypothetical protein